jgi:Tfp pilus assembly ATPase PilU
MSELWQLMASEGSSDLRARVGFPPSVQTNAKYGIVTLNGNLMEKFQAGMISREEVINKSQDPSTVMQKLAEWDAAQAELAEAQLEQAAA